MLDTLVIFGESGMFAELIEDQKTGLLYSMTNIALLASTIRWAFEHMDELEVIGHVAHLELERKCSRIIDYDQLQTVFESVV